MEFGGRTFLSARIIDITNTGRHECLPSERSDRVREMRNTDSSKATDGSLTMLTGPRRVLEMTKRTQFWIATCLFLALFSFANTTDAETKPNIVLIVADDLGWADLGAYGSTYYKTPSLDKLAAAGRRFTQGYSACPVCSPTRAAILTGKHPARVGITDWIPGMPPKRSQNFVRSPFLQQLPLDETTLAERLKAQGYATAHIGKWHLGGKGFEPTRQGFDLNIAGDELGSTLSYFAPFARETRVMPGLESAPKGEYLTDRLTDEAVHFIADHKSSPFFLYMPHFAVHTPIVAKPEVVAQYPAWDGVPHGRQENPTYAAMLQGLDESVGRVLAELDRWKLADKTIVIFTSDNGGLATEEGPRTPATFNAPLREGKGWVYEGGIRVPFIIRWTGKIEPGTETTPARSEDFVPTLLELTHSPAEGPFDGVSLAKLLTHKEPIAERTLIWHYPHYSPQGGRPSGAVREGDWKLVKDDTTGRLELFNLGNDVRESKNLSAEKPEKVAELAKKLEDWRVALGAKLATVNADYIPNEADKNGVITLPARTAEVHGLMLRYEPLPHKNTLGYWVNADDWASWEFDIKEPGEYECEALVGCGNGSGGSLVEFRSNGQTLRLEVTETGGFQAFQPRKLGRLRFESRGRFGIEVRATSKPKAAVTDLREIKLQPIKE